MLKLIDMKVYMSYNIIYMYGMYGPYTFSNGVYR